MMHKWLGLTPVPLAAPQPRTPENSDVPRWDLSMFTSDDLEWIQERNEGYYCLFCKAKKKLGRESIWTLYPCINKDGLDAVRKHKKSREQRTFGLCRNNVFAKTNARVPVRSQRKNCFNVAEKISSDIFSLQK
eukprot:Pompholyxophrys_punicea_v1_NODE_149_length_3194_cov_9.758203.p3 type:complete len:133 gc:universal NODE_149_length_3194_cov_9.758203:495-893(+)